MDFIKNRIEIYKKKGETSIEIVIGTIIFLIVFAALCDFIIISNRYLTLTDTTKELARTLSVQGGALTIKPGSYSANYYNIDQLSKVVQKQMNGMGFEDRDYYVSIKYEKIYDDDTKKVIEKEFTEKIFGIKNDNSYGYLKQTEKIEYLSDFSVYVTVRYHWPFLNSIFNLKPAVLEVSMPGVSEWKYSFDGWDTETGQSQIDEEDKP